MIECHNLSFTYPGAESPALTDLDLEVRPGERVVIVGPNGSGKSTLARLLCGLAVPTEGTLRVDDLDLTDVRHIPEVRCRMGLIFQDPDNQIVSAAVEREVAFGPENLGLPTEEIRRRVDEMLARFDLTRYAHREPARLSGGEKQRLCLASVLAMRPRYLVLDEPTSHLDSAGREALRAILEELRRTDNLATVMITQFPREVVEGDRVVAFDRGRKVYDGPADRMKEALREVEAFRDFFAPLPALDPSPAKGEKLLTAEGIGFAYRDLEGMGPQVLRGTSLELAVGEIVGLRGPSGSGKSTLLQILCDLMPPTEGTIRREGFTTMTFQFPERCLFAETVSADVRFGPANLGLSEEEQVRRADSALKRMGLDPATFGPRSPLALSSGEQRRVAIAGIVALPAKVYCFDEPTSGLDPSGVRQFLELLGTLREEGATVLLVSHDEDLLLAACSRVIQIM